MLAQTIDFDGVRRCDKLQLFISATKVRSGRLRIFRQHEPMAEVVLASACLPLLFQAVEIGGEAHRDGGFAGNPSLLPLITECPTDNLPLVQINPQLRETVPTSARDILDRMNEVTFNTGLLKELRSIALLQQLIQAEGRHILVVAVLVTLLALVTVVLLGTVLGSFWRACLATESQRHRWVRGLR